MRQEDGSKSLSKPRFLCPRKEFSCSDRVPSLDGREAKSSAIDSSKATMENLKTYTDLIVDERMKFLCRMWTLTSCVTRALTFHRITQCLGLDGTLKTI